MSDGMNGEGAMRRWLDEAVGALRNIDVAAVSRAATLLGGVHAGGGMIYTAGNGGSAATASHLALDLQKAAGVRSACLSDNVGLITAWANDAAFDRVFAEQLDTLATGRDAVVVISVSGSSPNLIALLEMARRKGVASVGLLGRDGGRAAALVDVPVVVPSDDYGWVESGHVVIHHVLAYALRDSLSLRAPLRKLAAQ